MLLGKGLQAVLFSRHEDTSNNIVYVQVIRCIFTVLQFNIIIIFICLVVLDVIS